jgi:hypothetical protein
VRTGVPYKGASALATAITAAASGDTIRVWGTCFGNFELGKDLTLQGKGKPATLDGNRTGRVLHITAGKATIRNLVITNGRTAADDAGGGILIDVGASAALVDTIVRDNTAGSGSFGGGIEANGNLLLIRSAVTRNSAGSSGGIDMNGPATVSLISSSVTHNSATHVPGALPNDGCGFAPDPLRYACGGGIWNFNGTLSLTDSTVNANTARYRGGGLRTSSTIQNGLVVSGITLLAGSTTIDAQHRRRPGRRHLRPPWRDARAAAGHPGDREPHVPGRRRQSVVHRSAHRQHAAGLDRLGVGQHAGSVLPRADARDAQLRLHV